ncbi:glycine cleavage system protein GcvH [Sporichthya sp.]|uniref:glycine cleavage system protein GcvH n=1 Tax=Sporichthya sp. TaxID=65475 RepID=UPI00185842CE|nr:glycine cleavage system protein GcvH [Sporichthya sp.]MBA3741776.1 glycine cleavage system protein GcvH [Sporichthya sp.]
MSVPDELKYTAEHEWAQDTESGSIRVGITDHAQEQLGDIVFVSLPQPGDRVVAGSPCGELESTKSVSEIYAPVSGEIVAVNSAIETAPELVNSEPYGGGWMFEVRPDDPKSLKELLTAAEYTAAIG